MSTLQPINALLAAATLAASIGGQPALADDWHNHFIAEIPHRVGLKTGHLNVRNGPGTTFQVIDKIPAGEGGLMLETCSENLKWCRVSYGGDGRKGWIATKYIYGYAD